MKSSRIALFSLVTAAVASGSSCWFFAPTGLDGFVEASIRAQCHFAFACCTAAERPQFAGVNFRDEGTCVEELLEQGNGANTVADRARAVLAAGKGTFNQEKADACLKPGLDAQNNCDAQTLLGDGVIVDIDCSARAGRGFVEGNVEDGDDCNDDIECASFGFCDRSDNDDDVVTTAGKCVAAKEEGEECVDSDFNFFQCVPGTFCNGFDAGSECEAVELKDNGDACFDDAECESNFCDPEGNGATECSFGGGEPCVVDEDCPNFGIGETCISTGDSVCGDRDVTVEVCDGLGQ